MTDDDFDKLHETLWAMAHYLPHEEDRQACVSAADLIADQKFLIEQLEAALRHCVNAISEWERKPEGVDGFLLGAMDNARAALGEKKDG